MWLSTLDTKINWKKVFAAAKISTLVKSLPMQVIPNFFIFFKPFNIQIFAVIRYFLGEISFTKVFLSWFFPFNRCSHRRCSVKKGVLKSFANFTGKHLWWSLFLINLEAFRPVSLLKRLQYRCFPVLSCKRLLLSQTVLCYFYHEKDCLL